MPLVSSILKDELVKFLDKDAGSFSGFPENAEQVAEKWANAVNEYAKSVIPASTTASTAKAAFKSVMLGISNAGNGLVLLTNAYSAYASALASGMSGAGFVGTPPPAPINLASIVPAGLNGASGSDIAEIIKNISDIWFKTGTAVPIAGGAVITWS